MEKLANNSSSGLWERISLRGLTILFTLTLSFQTFAQYISFDSPETYILGGLTVTGLQSYNEQTVKTYTGLVEGQPITIPGEGAPYSSTA